MVVVERAVHLVNFVSVVFVKSLAPRAKSNVWAPALIQNPMQIIAEPAIRNAVAVRSVLQEPVLVHEVLLTA